jgi:alcohol dehydrogenase YqhD (iron-dependent ADH family)
MKNKKLTKKEVKEVKLKFLKDNLENKKRVYEIYIQALVKYNIKNIAYSAITSDDLFQKELQNKMKRITKNKKSFMKEMFGNPKQTEEERIQDNINYYDKLIIHAQMKISMLDDETKTKIAKDAVEKGHGWLKLSSENYKSTKNEN